jgi:hypothetical protein
MQQTENAQEQSELDRPSVTDQEAKYQALLDQLHSLHEDLKRVRSVGSLSAILMSNRYKNALTTRQWKSKSDCVSAKLRPPRFVQCFLRRFQPEAHLLVC